MTRRGMALGLILVLALASGCGKYGKPRRTVDEAPPAAAAAGTSEAAGASSTGASPATPAAPTHRDETDPRVEGNRR